MFLEWKLWFSSGNEVVLGFEWVIFWSGKGGFRVEVGWAWDLSGWFSCGSGVIFGVGWANLRV